MLETEARVTKSENGKTWVQPQIGGCGGKQCASQGCGTAILTQIFSQQPRQFQVDNPIAAQPGDHVLIGIPEQTFMRSVMMVYLIPLASLFCGAFLATRLGHDAASRDLLAALGAVTGLALSLTALKIRSFKNTSRGANPTILRRL